MGVPVLQSADVLTESILQDCEECLVVLKKDPITNYPLWARWLLLFSYWVTNYDGGVELMSVCTSQDKAEAMCEDSGYRIIALPIDEPLPKERCQWKPAIHPKSPFRKLYKQHVTRLIAVDNARLTAGLNSAESGLLRLKNILTMPEDA